MTYVYIALTLMGLTYGLYVFYAAVMNIKRVHEMGKLNPLGKALGYPTLLIGYTLDVIVNLVVMTLVMLELPREWTVTARLKRHNRESTGWRLAVVKFL
jgi:hypothetical protein